MPSLFTRSRTTSTPSKAQNGGGGFFTDEFGRVTSRGSIGNGTPSKKDKKKDKDKGSARQRTKSEGPNGGGQEGLDVQSLPDGSFLPFSYGQKDEELKLRSYGYLSYQCEVTLGIEEVSRLVDVIAHELNERGLTTPLLFSNQALDISRNRIHRLIDTFLATCPTYMHAPNSSADLKWREEARFAGPHELGMTLRWGLARIVRIHGGQETRGILAWEHYLRWRESEAASSYPQTYFNTFLPFLPPTVQPLLLAILSLMSRLTTHATSSGLTPATLAALFGPLLFGLGSSSLPFHHTYGAYLRCSHATEHLLLSYIRSQSGPLPSRLADWIRGYPAMLPKVSRLDKARPGAKVMRLNTVKRNVRLYSTDLVRSAAAWDLGGSKEWARVVGPPSLKLGVKYSDEYRKRMDLESKVVPDMNVRIAVGSIKEEEEDEDKARRVKEEDARFRSLTELKWGEFESAGFGGVATEKRLQFDLNEGARNARNEKHTTLSWNDFSTSGFTRTDGPLSATLQFSTPVASTINQWPQKNQELHNKLKKTQKNLPPFTWDTNPILGGEEAVEAGFVDCFCDLLYGSGWVDRTEGTFRECNWAVVEYKSMPQVRPNGMPPADPRAGTSLWLYEEFVPPEYRAQLTAPKRKIIPFPFIKNTYHATTPKTPPRAPNAREIEFEGLLAGGGNVTKVISLGGGERERDRVMSGGSGMQISSPLYVAQDSSSLSALADTKFLHSHTAVLGSIRSNDALKAQSSSKDQAGLLQGSHTKLNLNTAIAMMKPTPPLPTTTTHAPSTPTPHAAHSGAGASGASGAGLAASVLGATTPTPTGSASKRASFLTGRSMRRRGVEPAEYDATLEFETRTMALGSDDEEEVWSEGGTPKGKHRKGESKDDAWVDILVGSQRRMDDQAAEMRGGPRVRKRRSAEDGELMRVHEEMTRKLREGPEDGEPGIPVQEEEQEGEGEQEETTASKYDDVDADTIGSGDFEPMPHMKAPSQDERATTPTRKGEEVEGVPVNSRMHAVAGTLGASRLPARSSSLKAEAIAEPPKTPDPQPASTFDDSEEDFADEEDDTVSLEGADLEAYLSRHVKVNPATPRYVHGAPLHNVVEAPEEEESEAVMLRRASMASRKSRK